jgi:hypothetical protein
VFRKFLTGGVAAACLGGLGLLGGLGGGAAGASTASAAATTCPNGTISIPIGIGTIVLEAGGAPDPFIGAFACASSAEIGLYYSLSSGYIVAIAGGQATTIPLP